MSCEETLGRTSSDTVEEPNPFAPFPDSEPNERRILTLRAILVGSLCGTLVNASNIYLGLKAGWTTSANIFGSIIGFVVLKQWSASSFSSHAFGPHENNIVQTAATAAGGLSGVFVSAIPALYKLGLLKTPGADYFHLTLLTGLGGLFGLFSVAPLRHFFLVQVARELDLRFPSSTATATTIRSVHQAVEGGMKARRKLRVMVIAFVAALILRVASQYAIGILWDWHPFTWMVTTGITVSAAMSLESWGWYIEWTPAFIGSAMLVSVNVAVSFLAGSVLAWGIIGPLLVSNGIAFGQHRSSEEPWTEPMSYTSLSKELATADHPSPRDRVRLWMWLPGVIFVIVLSCPALKGQFGMSYLLTLLSLFLAFGMSLLAIQATGATDTTPLGTLSKVSQVILGSLNNQPSIAAAQRLNLIGGALTNIGASQATDLMGDFRVGFLLGTPPSTQYLTQIIGTLLATFISPLIFMIFSTAYPCILASDPNPTDSCEFSLPAASAWRVIAVAATEPTLPIPRSSVIFSITMGILGSAMVLLRHFILVDKWAHARKYHPNLMILAMAFTLPATHYGIAMVIGALVAAVWRKRSLLGYEEYGAAVAAGLMAGEGIGGSVNALLSILGVGGEGWGTGVGCPAGMC
ncbi:OPT superfamily oligopeptide transporter [Aspergillus pseudodeflectus]|uniref:OPT superfamily oligopeptide transporter n=1 Tax=Aspergillus pseudodeflectus TaxID=176178 RepID=A0ABR4L4W1_9EURO